MINILKVKIKSRYMNNKLSVYDISFNNENTSLYLSIMSNECASSIKSFQAYILNKKSENIDFIEKIVYDLSKFHLDNMNKDIRNENITIEFWFKANITKNHIDGDVNGIGHRGFSCSPLCSILVYLNDNENPTLLTNIDNESYKYKKITNKELFLIFPKKLKSIIFDRSYYHSEIDIFDNRDTIDRNVLVIDIWEDYIPLFIENYESKYLTPSPEVIHYADNSDKTLKLFYENNTIDTAPHLAVKECINNDLEKGLTYSKKDKSIITIYPDNVINKIPITNYNLDDKFFLDLLYNSDLYRRSGNLVESLNGVNCCKIFRDIAGYFSQDSITDCSGKGLNKTLYNGYIHIHNEVVAMKSSLKQIDSPLKQMDDPSYIKEPAQFLLQSFREHQIHITQNFIKEDVKKYVLANFTKYGELDISDNLLKYILNHIASDICDEIKNIYLLDETYKINIQNVFLSRDLTTNENNTIVASICLYNDFLFKTDTSEIMFNSSSLVFQNSFYKNKCKDQIFIEFLVDIENNIQ